MHAAALHLAPVLAAEKSKVPFYVAGGVLVAWALVVSLGFGLRRVDFPDTLGGERAVMAITAVLVLGAVSTAVITSGTESKAGAQTSTKSAASSAPPPGAPAPSTTASTSTTGAPPTKATSAPAPAPGATTSL